MKACLLSFVLIIPMLSPAQEMLVTRGGREFAFQTYKIRANGSVIDLRTKPKDVNSIPADSVAEMVSFGDEKIYHLKHPKPHSREVAFLELVTSGKVTVYRRVLRVRQAGSGILLRGPMSGTYYDEVEQYFVEKEGVLKQILPAPGLSWLQKGLLLKEYVSDDAEAVREIDNVNFRLKAKSLVRVVEDYNARYFEPRNADETDGLVSFIFVGDHHVTMPLTVQVEDQTWQMNDEALPLPIPITADTRVCITDGVSEKCKVVRGTRHFPIYFEVCSDETDKEIELTRSHSKKFSRHARRMSNAGLP